jgi:very-short-patch-repair endonuclease
LTQQRIELIKRLRESRQQLLYARQDEYRAVVLAGEEFSPSDAARLVKSGCRVNSWIPAPVTLGAPLPLSDAELTDLYRTNLTVSPEDEKELSFNLPNPEDLMAPADFENLMMERDHLSQQDLRYREDLWGEEIEERSTDELEGLLNSLSVAVRPLGDNEGWALAAISAGREGGGLRAVWEKLLAQVEAVLTESSNAQEFLLQFSPTVPEDCLPGRAGEVADEISEHLRQGRKLGWLNLLTHSEWKTLIEAARVNQQPPKVSEHFQAISQLVRLRASRTALRNRWQAQVTSLSGPALLEGDPAPERICRQYSDRIGECLNWYNTTWSSLEQEMSRVGLNWKALLLEAAPNHSQHGDLLRIHETVVNKLPSVLRAQKNRLLWGRTEAKILSLSRTLDSFSVNAMSSEVVQRLRVAVKRGAILAYTEAYDRLVEIRNHQKDLIRRGELLSMLEPAAPAWAAAIRNREAQHAGGVPPGNPTDAWQWRQLHDELERRGRVSLETLQERIDKLGKQLRETTAELTEKKAWLAQARRTSLEQRQALRGWKEFMRRVGRGTGIRAPRLLAEARKLIPVCQSAVPVWIMPLNRVVESFDPQKNSFDVVIIDEASQADVMSMAALYLGKEIIIVGDHEQVSPLAVSQRQEEVQQLIDEHLTGIPNANLYDGQMSIYDLAKTSFEGMICLREHFRCVSQIIQFSNYLSYNGDIKPLRDASAVARRPHTIAYRVEGEGVDAKGVNEQEAYTIASLLIACTEQPEYEDASFGVISLVGEQQAGFIEKLLRRFLPPAEYVRRRLQSGNSANFQGDERDVMFLSVVDTPGGDGPLSLRREGAQNLFKKRFNVAASRARDQMWVVYSLDPEIHLQPEDIRRRLIMHARDPDAISRERERQEANVESEFERQVLGRLLQAGYRVTPQWKVGAYRIDLVVEGNGKRLAVECDGDRWHPPEKLQEDLERQAILERLGWRFARIRGSQFFRDPDTAMRHVFERIEQLGISAEGMRLTEPEDQMTTNALKDQIIRRAAELRRQWRDAGEDAVIHPGRGSGSLRSRQRKRRGTKTDSGHDQTQNRDSTAKSGTPLDEQPPQLPSLGMRQQRKI